MIYVKHPKIIYAYYGRLFNCQINIFCMIIMNPNSYENTIHEKTILQTELSSVFFICFLSFLNWFGAGNFTFQLIPTVGIFIMGLINPINIVAYLIVDELIINTQNIRIGVLSLPIALAYLMILFCLLKHRGFTFIYNRIFLLLVLLTIYQVISNYLYFKNLNFTILNNFMFCFIICWGLDLNKKKEITRIMMACLCANGIVLLISLIYHLSNQGSLIGPFGHIRQVGFFSVLSISYLIVFSEIYSQNNTLNLLIRIYFGTAILLNVISNSRLNVIIIFVLMVLMYWYRVGSSIIKKNSIIITLIAIVLSAFIFNVFISKYFFRNLSGKAIGAYMVKDTDQFAELTSGRTTIYKYGTKMFLDYPIFGRGYLCWNHISNTYNPTITKNADRLSMHSTHLQYLAETGIVGLGLYWLLLFYLFKVGTKSVTADDKSTQYYLGIVILFVTISLFIGGILDNHSLSYRQVYMVAAFAIINISDKFPGFAKSH